MFHLSRRFRLVLQAPLRQANAYSFSLSHSTASRFRKEFINYFSTATQSKNNIISFKLADIGEGITEVELLSWALKEGDTIEEMGDVCVVQSDKSAVEISSPITGSIVKLHHKIGDMIKIGAPLADIKVQTLETIIIEEKVHETNVEKEAKEDVTVTNEPKEEKNRGDTVSFQTKEKGKLNASPAVRALASEKNVNVEDVVGTGKNGIITKQDILEFVKNKNETVEKSKKTETPLVEKTKTEPVKQDSKKTKDSRQDVEKEEVLLTSPISKGMIKSMNQSLSVPYMSLQEDIDITDLLRNRTVLNNFLKSQNAQEKLTVTTFIVKALSKALQMVPILNSKFDTVKADRYMLYHSHNVSIAIDTPYGLVVPNIKNVQNLSLQQIQRELTELGTLAKNNRLSMNHLTGGTITLSNVGVIGGTAVRPIVFDGQACIVGLGRTQKLPRFDASSKNIECHDIMNLTASVDHRHIDGATVARFIKVLREILQDPTLLSL